MTMKKTYQKPEIWVEELKTESPLLGTSDSKVTKTAGNAEIKYGGGGSGPARAGENSLWDDDDDSGWGGM